MVDTALTPPASGGLAVSIPARPKPAGGLRGPGASLGAMMGKGERAGRGLVKELCQTVRASNVGWWWYEDKGRWRRLQPVARGGEREGTILPVPALCLIPVATFRFDPSSHVLL